MSLTHAPEHGDMQYTSHRLAGVPKCSIGICWGQIGINYFATVMDAIFKLDLPDQYNLVDHFVDRHVREGRGDKTAIISGAWRITYRELAEQVNRVGNALLRLGLQEEQRVLLVLPDSPEFAAAYFGAMKLGAVAVPTNTALREMDYAYFLRESRARIAIVHSTSLPEFRPALVGQKYCKRVVVCGNRVDGFIHWDQFLQNRPPNLRTAPTSKDDAAFWLWTSGSTGRPKAAVHSHHDWIHCCECYARGVLDMRTDDVTFSTSKLYHAYGLGNGLMFPMHVGATTILYQDRPQARAILETAEANRPTIFYSVPTLYAAMLEEADRGTTYDLRSVRLAVSAGEPLPAQIFCRWKERFGVEILDGIGSTEVLHIYLSARSGQVKPGSTGQAVPGYELSLVDQDGEPVADGEVGELIVAGPSTAQRYWNRQALSTDRMRGRWFFTGDKYTKDKDGYYWYAGRSDDMFRVSGQWVSPVEVEWTLIEHPRVLEAAVVAFEEETHLQTSKAFVVLRNGDAGSAELVSQLQDFVKRRITPYKYPRHIEFVSELPKSSAGKILRYKLREVCRAAVAEQAQTRDVQNHSQEQAEKECLPDLAASPGAKWEAARGERVVTSFKAAGVVGAGTMGRGIAMCFINAGISVLLKDTKQEVVESALRAIRASYQGRVQKGKISVEEMEHRLSGIQPQLDYDGFDAADVVVEAAFENLEVKRAVFRELGEVVKPGAILATNTSYLSVDEIAAGCSRPEAVIGLHFFSPAHVMRLLEVVPGKVTAKSVTAGALALAKRLGKTAVVAGNCPGFIGNRMLRAYRWEAQLLLEEGASPYQVDSTLEQWGMAMGPFAAQDLAGIDIAMSSRHVFEALQRPGFRKPRVIEMLYERGRLGQKTGSGWYRYDDKRMAHNDPAVEALIERTAREAGTTRRSITAEEIIDRTIYALINEGSRILEEGHASRASDIDLVHVNGYGFPAFRGGPMHYADEVGLQVVYKRILEFRVVHGEHWEASLLLARLAESGRCFRGLDPAPETPGLVQ
jgi:benzoate-CoA ligase family protein